MLTGIVQPDPLNKLRTQIQNLKNDRDSRMQRTSYLYYLTALTAFSSPLTIALPPLHSQSNDQEMRELEQKIQSLELRLRREELALLQNASEEIYPTVAMHTSNCYK